jgi:hypothetical protein
MERFTDVQPVRLIDSRAADPLRLAVASYLARYTGSSRDHAYSDLRCFLSWCAERGLDPLAASRVQLELYMRWMQEVRRYKPSTVSRRLSEYRVLPVPARHGSSRCRLVPGADGRYHGIRANDEQTGYRSG